MRLFTALSAWLVSTCALASPFAVQLGDSRLALDSPPGFSDTTFTGSPRLQELAETLASPSTRILLFALSDGDLRRFTVGDPLELRRYMVAVTPSGMERDRITQAAFQRLVDEQLRDLGKVAPEGEDYTKHLAKNAPGAQAFLAELRREPSVVSVLQGSRLPPTRQPSLFGPEEKAQFVLGSTSLMVLRGKALTLSVFTKYDSPADVAWIRAITLRWIEDLQRLNGR